MTASPSISTISSADLQAAIVALIQQNNIELKQLMLEVLPTLITIKPKKQRKSIKNQRIAPLKSRVPYSEMPFWKANPHLKPADAQPYAMQEADFKALQHLFQDPTCPPIETWMTLLD
jgi:hypothetical protein